MSLFGDKKYIKNSKEVKRALNKTPSLHLTRDQKKEVLEEAKKFTSEGLSKKEWKKITKNFRESHDDGINRTKAERLKRFGQ